MSTVPQNVQDKLAETKRAQQVAQDEFTQVLEQEKLSEHAFLEFINALDSKAEINSNGHWTGLNPARQATESLATRADGGTVYLKLYTGPNGAGPVYSYSKKGIDSHVASLLIKAALDKALKSEDLVLLENFGAALPTLLAPLQDQQLPDVKSAFDNTIKALDSRGNKLNQELTEVTQSIEINKQKSALAETLNREFLSHMSAEQTQAPAEQQGQSQQKE